MGSVLMVEDAMAPSLKENDRWAITRSDGGPVGFPSDAELQELYRGLYPLLTSEASNELVVYTRQEKGIVIELSGHSDAAMAAVRFCHLLETTMFS